MSIQKNIQTVKDFFAAIGRADREALLALVAEDIEWIIPGKDWPLAATYRGHARLADLLETASRSMETSTEPRGVCRTGRPRSRGRFCQWEGQSHEQAVRGRLDLRHHDPGRQTDQHPGICRHASTGPGLADAALYRAANTVRQFRMTPQHLAVNGDRTDARSGLEATPVA